MEERPDYYQLLHVQPDAPIKVIKASFRTLMLALDHHPDRGGDHEYAAQLNEAYHILSNQARRQEYDRDIQDRSAPREPVSPSSFTPAPARDRTARIVCPFCKTANWDGPGATLCSHCGSPLGDAVETGRIEGYGRTAGRMPKEQPLVYYTSWPANGQPGRLCDISPGGIRFLGNAAVTPDQILKIDRPPMKATGRVIYCQSTNHDGFRYAIGVDFTAVAFDTDS